MPSINIKLSTYSALQDLMAIELKNKLQNTEPKIAMAEIIKNKFGVTFDSICIKLILEYKQHHKIK